MQYALNYSGTRFLSIENQNYSISWWIPSEGQMSKISGYTNKMKWENSTVQTDQRVSKGCWYALHVDHDSVTVKKTTNQWFIALFFSPWVFDWYFG